MSSLRLLIDHFRCHDTILQRPPGINDSIRAGHTLALRKTQDLLCDVFDRGEAIQLCLGFGSIQLCLWELQPPFLCLLAPVKNKFSADLP